MIGELHEQAAGGRILCKGFVAKMLAMKETGDKDDEREASLSWNITPRSNGVTREADIILVCVRWYLRYPLSYRHLEEMMGERGLHVDHTTIYRWVQHFAPELNRRCRSRLKSTNDSWRVEETYVKVKGTWMYLYRAVDSAGNTLEFLLSPTRDAEAAKQVFHKTLSAAHTVTPRVITVDKNPAYQKRAHRPEDRWGSTRLLRTASSQIPQQHH
jgi:transposase-like protein